MYINIPATVQTDIVKQRALSLKEYCEALQDGEQN
jgi:hypothetical protein